MMKILLFTQLVIGLLLITVILLQRSNNDGMGTLSGSNMGVVNARSAATFLTRLTVILIVLFFGNSLILANLSTKNSSSALDQLEKAEQKAEVQEEAAVKHEATAVPIAN